MPRLAVISYPALRAADRDWIESIRATRDPQAARLAAHFTLVFPAEVASDRVAEEIAAVAGSVRPIPFVIRAARAVRDVFHRRGHVFLVPEEGSREIAWLHDRLYEGVFKRHFRGDIPFAPHITVAAARDFAWCETFADELERRALEIPGMLRDIELVSVAGGAVVSVEKQPPSR